MELPNEIKAILDQLGEQLRSVDGEAAAKIASALNSASETLKTEPAEPPSQPGWKDRLAAWWRALKKKSRAFWNRATLAAKQLVKWLADKVSGFGGQNNRDWLIAGLVLAAAIAVIVATVKSLALIVALLAAFGLLALVRIIQRLQTVLLP